MLFSCVQQSESVLYAHTRAHTHAHTGLLFFKFFHHTGHYRVLSRVPYSTMYMSIPISQFILLPFSPVTIYFLYPWFYFCFVGFPDDSAVKKIGLQCRRHRFSSWVRKVLWRRTWKPTPVFLPGKSHRQRSLVGYSLWGFQESDTTQRTLHTCTHFCLVNKLFCTIFFFHSTHKQYNMVLVLLCLTYFIQYNSL